MIADRFDIFDNQQESEGFSMTIGELTKAAGVERFEIKRIRIDGKSCVLMFAGKGSAFKKSSVHYLPNSLNAKSLENQATELCGRVA